MATPHIGSVNLDYALAWPNKPIASIGPGKIGADVETITGDVVFVRGKAPITSKPIKVKFLYNWESSTTVAALDALWAAGTAVTIDPEGDGSSYTFKFAVEDGMSEPEHCFFGKEAVHYHVEGYPGDRFRGEINGWITAGL